MKELRRLRELAGLTQFDVSKKSGVERSRLSTAECGHVTLTVQEQQIVRRILMRAIEDRQTKLQAVLEKPETVTAEA